MAEEDDDFAQEEEEEEEEEEEVAVEGDEDDDDEDVPPEEGQTQYVKRAHIFWAERGFGSPKAEDKQAMSLQVIDIEHQKRILPAAAMDDPEVTATLGKRWRPMVPCVRLYCKDRGGASICVNVYGYYPVVHLLTSVPVSDYVIEEMRNYVEDLLREQDGKGPFPKKRPENWRAILSAKPVPGFPAFPYVSVPCTFIEFKLADAVYIKQFGRLMRQNGGHLDSPALGPINVMPYSCHDIVDKFQTDLGVSGFGWIDIHRFMDTDKRGHNGDASSCVREIDTSVTWMRSVKGIDEVAPLRKITYDIECLKTKGMPDPEKDAVIVISAICGEYRNGQPAGKRKVLLQYGRADPVKNIDPANGDVHLCFEREKEMLEAFGGLVEEYDPDYLCGHNMIGFDQPYLVVRANKIDADPLRFLGRRQAYKWTKPRRVVKRRKNGETRETKMTATPGRIQLDTFNWILNGFEKERSYRLGHLAAKYLNDNKDDVGYSMIGPMWRQSDATRARLGKYCMKDSELTEALCDLSRYQMVISSIEMSRQTRVPACKLLRSGVQVKVWGLLLEKAKSPHFDEANTPVFFPDEEVRERGKDDKFPGAFVLEPVRDYYDDWLGCGDFTSLYPSIIIDLNICYTTELRGAVNVVLQHKQSPNGVKFIDRRLRIGLLPQMEVELMAARTVARRQAKEAVDPGAQTMYEKRQNEIKIICNSVYGIMTASGGRLTRMEMGEAVTSQGRLMIETAKGIAEGILVCMDHEKKGEPFKVIYGDSVLGDTPLYIKRTAASPMEIIRIDDLYDSFGTGTSRIDAKDEHIVPDGSGPFVWSDAGWTHVRRLIRHTVDKQICRVLTHTGVVDCTEDHSLVGVDGIVLSPKEAGVGTCLMHRPITETDINVNASSSITVDEAWVMGAFLADGYADGKYHWCIAKLDGAHLQLVQDRAPFRTEIGKTYGVEGHYTRRITSGTEPSKKYRRLFYDEHREKRVPLEILNAPLGIVQIFLDGFYAGNGSNKKEQREQKIKRFDVKGKTTMTGLAYLYQRLGLHISINDRKNKHQIFRLTVHSGSYRRNEVAIKRMRVLSEHEEHTVYDLETESHHFHVGPGNLVVHNTDSIFIQFPKWVPTQEEAFKWLRVVCDAVNRHFASQNESGISPIKLQAEKCMKNGILINKKRYIFMKYESPTDKGKMLAKGVETARRDNCQMVVDCMNQIVAKLFGEGDRNGALAVLSDTLRDLMAGRTDIGKLVISKAISKDNYRNEPPHLAVARKMKLRDPSYESGPAERIPFVVVANGGKNVTEKAEDPLWAIKQQIPIDVDYYVHQQLAGPVSRILMWMYGSAQDKQSIATCENRLRELQTSKEFGRIKSAKDCLVKAIKLMQKGADTRFFGLAAMRGFPRRVQSTAGKRGAIDSYFAAAASSKRCAHGNPANKCPECAAVVIVNELCPKCGLSIIEGTKLCERCNPRCIRCNTVVAAVLDGDLCAPCAEHRCRMCGEALLPEAVSGTVCKTCAAADQIRKRLKVSVSSASADIEDMLRSAAAAKLKCDKCRGYADETEIRCVQKDCVNLYRRATLDVMLKNALKK